MADNGGGSNAFIGFILGGVVVVVAILAFVVYSGGFGSKTTTSTIKIEVPKVTGSK